jgi:hypothetical protein
MHIVHEIFVHDDNIEDVCWLMMKLEKKAMQQIDSILVAN